MIKARVDTRELKEEKRCERAVEQRTVRRFMLKSGDAAVRIIAFSTMKVSWIRFRRVCLPTSERTIGRARILSIRNSYFLVV